MWGKEDGSHEESGLRGDVWPLASTVKVPCLNKLVVFLPYCATFDGKQSNIRRFHSQSHFKSFFTDILGKALACHLTQMRISISILSL